MSDSRPNSDQHPWLISRSELAICGLLIGFIWFIYYQTLYFNFIHFDDGEYVYDNPHVLSGLNWLNIKWAFTNVDTCLWLPLTWLSLMLDSMLFGTTGSGYHLTNMLLHTANSLLLFLFLRYSTKAFWCSAITAILFAVHPLRVESVVWITERKDVLMLFGLLLSLWAYKLYLTKPSIGRYLVIAFCYLLALMAKPVVVTFPLFCCY